MRHLKTCIVIAALFGGSVRAAPPITAMAWLVGGVWTADAAKLGPGMQRIETRYQWSDNGSYVRFTTHFVTDKTELKTYDGNFFWDPAKNEIAMWYMDAKNAIIQDRSAWMATGCACCSGLRTSRGSWPICASR